MANYLPWEDDESQTGVANRLVEFAGDQRAIETLKNGTVTREIITPYGTAKTSYKMPEIAPGLTPTIIQPAAAKANVSNTPVVPSKVAPSAPAASAPSGDPVAPAIVTPGVTAVLPGSGVSDIYEPHNAMPSANTDGIKSWPRIFNPGAFDVRGSKSAFTDSEPGINELASFLQKRGARRFGINTAAGNQIQISGRNSRELASNWVEAMKTFKYNNDQGALSQMTRVAQDIYSPQRKTF